MDKTIYILFDLETTGRFKTRNKIIEIASICLDKDGDIIDNSEFASLINPDVTIPTYITQLTNITQDMVRNKELFNVVCQDFIKHNINIINDYEQETKTVLENIVLVAHNGRRFDVPFLFYHMNKNNLYWPDEIKEKLYILDTRDLAEHSVRTSNLRIPHNFQLSTLYYYCTGKFEIVMKCYTIYFLFLY